MEWIEYRQEWRRRAFSGNLVKAEVASGFLAVLLAPLGANAVWGPIVSWRPTILFAVVAVGLCIYGCVRAPYWMYEELRKERDQLQDRIKPRLAIRGLIQDTEPAGVTGHAIRAYAVTVKNVGNETLTNCLAKLTELCGRQSGERRQFLPVGMITQHQYWQHRTGGRFDLRPDEEKNVMLALLDERQESSEIILLYETDEYPKGIPRNDVYDLTIQAFGAPTPPSARYKMEVVDGHLRITEIKE